MNFNPRSSCEERLYEAACYLYDRIFQSTLLMRGATSACAFAVASPNISIHAPHARSDLRLKVLLNINPAFQSTLLMRGATCQGRAACDFELAISIHAPHARSDNPLLVICCFRDLFQSTLLMRGATRPRSARCGMYSAFQSTLLMRGATVSILGIDLPDFIIYFSRTYPFSPKMPTSRHLSCKLHFLCDGTSHFGDL